MSGTYDKHGNYSNYSALPSSAEGHVARRIPVERVTDDSREAPHEDPIDTYCGPVWVGGACFILLACGFFWAALVACVRWIWEVIG